MIPIPMPPQQQQVQLPPPTPQQQVGGQQGLGQQQQQQHAQQLGQTHQQQGQPGQPFIPPPPPSGQDWTLSSILHYLQSEWRRYERDRNEWEIERAESIARCAPHGWRINRHAVYSPYCVGLLCLKVKGGLSKMSKVISCAVSKCWNMLFVLNGTSAIPLARQQLLILTFKQYQKFRADERQVFWIWLVIEGP